LVLQSSPKVVVQRSGNDIVNATQMVDQSQQQQQTVQYYYQSMDQVPMDQMPQLVIQQQPQLKQTIYPQQAANQVS